MVSRRASFVQPSILLPDTAHWPWFFLPLKHAMHQKAAMPGHILFLITIGEQDSKENLIVFLKLFNLAFLYASM